MIQIEKFINEYVPVNNTFTCVSCATNDNKVVYNIKIHNYYTNSVIPLCSECIKKLELDIEFLRLRGELEDATDERDNQN